MRIEPTTGYIYSSELTTLCPLDPLVHVLQAFLLRQFFPAKEVCSQAFLAPAFSSTMFLLPCSCSYFSDHCLCHPFFNYSFFVDHISYYFLLPTDVALPDLKYYKVPFCFSSLSFQYLFPFQLHIFLPTLPLSFSTIQDPFKIFNHPAHGFNP